MATRMALTSAITTDDGGMSILLYPVPRSLQTTGGSVVPPQRLTASGAPDGLLATLAGPEISPSEDGWIRFALGHPHHPGDEAYRLTVSADGVGILARTPTGQRWGLATLVQLLRACPDQLPCLVIEDAPAFRQRGFMLDISRDRVPTMATLYDLVDRMAALKLNHLQLYTEHTFAYAGHEAVWRSADPITPAEMRQLDAYAAERGVALHANQNTFGHFERWLRHPRYASLGELAEPWIYPGWGSWQEPSTLCPLDPGSLALVADLLAQIIPCCSGIYANIGGDEPVDLGAGRSREACAMRGRGRVFSDYLGQVLRTAQRLGKRPQFWCDPKPNEDGSLPRDIAVLVWGYGEREDFAPRLAAHAAAGREVWVAPGTGNWRTYAGRTAERRGNLARAACDGMAASATGLLNTEWGDLGHRQQWPLALFGMADGAQAAWSGTDQFDDRAAGLHALGSADLGVWMARLGRADAGIAMGYGSATFVDGDTPWNSRADPSQIPAWQAVADELAAVQRDLPPVGGLVEAECRLAVGLACFAADRAVARRQGGDPATQRAFWQRLAPLAGAYRRLWLARSRYGGLEDSYAKLKALLAC